MQKEKVGYLLLGLIGLVAIIGFSLSDPIEQDLDYHNFSDGLTIARIPNFWNVVSNLPFLLVGVLGVLRLKNMNCANLQFLIFFVGVSLVAFGSGYYHLSPDNHTLVWDRLPMTVAFTALISIVVSEFIHLQTGKRLLWPLVALGVVSIVYWVQTGDLRFYALVQFYPMVGIPIVLVFFKSASHSTKGFWWLLMAYLLAKVFETFDAQIHDLLGFMSGHPLKHVAAAFGVYMLIHSFKEINANQETQS